MTQSEQTSLVHRALDLGVNFIDTSAEYGDSEAILGRALDGVPRDSYYLCTKWPSSMNGELIEDPQLLADSVERSLDRLATDHVDVMMFHGPLSADYTAIVERFYSTMERLREQGKIRHIGLSTQYVSEPAQGAAELAMKLNPQLWDVLMLKYGLLNQSLAKEVLPLAIEHGVGIMNMAAVRVKLPDPDLLQQLMHEWAEEGYIERGELSEDDPLGWLVHDEVTSVVAAGYKFAADHPAISTVVTGTSSEAHLEENAAALEKPYLSADDTRRAKELFGDIVEYV
jgi:aryl-alcohol dehydrogenase-like predicted oxidoreductase